MELDSLRDYVLAKEDVEECFPFGPGNFVYKTRGKIFMLISTDEEVMRTNLKCDPEYAVELRENYPNAIIPGYHMNKKHWNTLILENGNGLKLTLIKVLIDMSYNLVKGKKQ